MGNKYISCMMIESGFDANVDSINFCCRSSEKGQGFKAIFPNFTGGKIDWDKFFEIKNLYRNQLKEGKMIPECRGCIYLEEKEWPEGDYVSSINLNNWTVCNAKCIYCGLDDMNNQKKKFKHYDMYPIFKDMVENKILRRGGHITIAGGEPCIINEFEKIIKLLLDNNYDTIRVLTNATKYSKGIERGLKSGAVNIAVSTDSGRRETFKIIKRIDAHKKVWENIKKYASIQKEPSLVKTKYIIIPGLNDNYTEIDEWFNMNIKSGVKAIAVDIEQGWFLDNSNNIPERVHVMLNYLIQKAQSLDIVVEPHDRAVLMIKSEGNKHKLKFHGREI